ncbi:hypothetical protein TBLA_0G02510 [Henningerozyma blattae CBS 6284]|uniref:protein-tyrosine-phosphatase n=1 Tax=Henningerozyma blattae (strain ATCC 34711 / CBS 6284 / DSM 70876 / NBRC 10599 / NRRL Y-10934 / UCD 77-7) TaxID=1071380 RepID=I2H738_HENB6|nr:hypothetical protein TBLA_0G02510 [Tetrapisispora blattae CBS 6284]CCH62190.1 hypothetical protein TBLA_0G02510 [Tetrapisispora blattae CBS 6284]
MSNNDSEIVMTGSLQRINRSPRTLQNRNTKNLSLQLNGSNSNIVSPETKSVCSFSTNTSNTISNDITSIPSRENPNISSIISPLEFKPHLTTTTRPRSASTMTTPFPTRATTYLPPLLSRKSDASIYTIGNTITKNNGPPIPKLSSPTSTTSIAGNNNNDNNQSNILLNGSSIPNKLGSRGHSLSLSVATPTHNTVHSTNVTTQITSSDSTHYNPSKTNNICFNSNRGRAQTISLDTESSTPLVSHNSNNTFNFNDILKQRKKVTPFAPSSSYSSSNTQQQSFIHNLNINHSNNTQYNTFSNLHNNLPDSNSNSTIISTNTNTNINNNSPFNNDNYSPEEYVANAYPNGPLLVVPPNIYLYSEPNLDEILKFDVIINVAKEIPNLKASLIDNPHNKINYYHIHWSHNSKIYKDLNYLTNMMHDYSIQNKRILVHCQCGVSRSASLIVAYIMRYCNMNLNDAYDHLKLIAKDISPNMGLIFQLTEWNEYLNTNEKNNDQIGAKNNNISSSNNSPMHIKQIPSDISITPSDTKQSSPYSTNTTPVASNIDTEQILRI